jgi:hypothetical protein
LSSVSGIWCYSWGR